MKENSSYKSFCVGLMIMGILVININFYFQFSRNLNNFNSNDISSIRSNQGTITIFEWTPYGSVSASSPAIIRGEHDYFEWSINTLYGPGFTWYMMNDTEFWDMIALPKPNRTRGNFSYTALLSDEEKSASGIFYPQYADTWWFLTINHYTGYNCSAEFTESWYDDFITINEPNSSSLWAINTSRYINWTWGGDFAFVDIDLYYNDTFLTNIATNAQNNGSYLWRISDSISVFDDLYQINISNSDYSETWDISDYFEIYTNTITVTTPDSSSSWETDSSHYIYWTSTGYISDVKIELYKDDTFELEIIATTTNDGDYYWTVPSGLDDSTQYQIKISDVSNPSIYDYSEYFEIYTNTITITTPDSSSSWETDSSHYIYWTSTGNISDVKIELYKDNTLVMEVVSSTSNDGEYYWTIPSGLDGSTQYQIKISDLSNPSTHDLSDHFEIFTTTDQGGVTRRIPLELTILSSIIGGGVVIGVALLLFRRRRKRIQ